MEEKSFYLVIGARGRRKGYTWRPVGAHLFNNVVGLCGWSSSACRDVEA